MVSITIYNLRQAERICLIEVKIYKNWKNTIT